MEFRVLGPLEVVLEGRSLALGGAKQRALLAVLILDANRIVSTDRLIDALWGDEASDGAAHTLQVYVSQMRKALRTEGSPPPDALLVRQGTGYVLRVEPGSVDLQRFEGIAGEGRRALAAGEPERAAEILREALGLWRGPPLPEFAHEAFAEPAIARIEDLWLSAVEDRIEADLAIGGHTELVGELQTLVMEHPLRERLRGYLMLALYRSGRQAEALQVYRDARQLLADELGIDPSPDLRRLERAILEQDPELDVASGGARYPTRPAPRRPRWRVGVVLLAGVLVAAGVTAVVMAGGSDPRSPVSSVEVNNVGRIDLEEKTVVSSIPTAGNGPTATVWFSGSLWVANTVSRTVARIDPETERVVQTVPTEGAPTALAVGEGLVWVLNGLHGKVQAIDPRTTQVVVSIDVPAGSGGIAFGAGAVWVTNTLDGSVTRINPQTRQIDRTISLVEEANSSPKAIAASGDSLWVGDDLSPILLQIDPETGKVLATPGLRAVPTNLAIGGDGTVWVTSYEADLVSVLQPDTLQTTTVEVGGGPMGLAVGQEGVWVANSEDATVARIDPRSEQVVDTIRIGPIPDQVALGGGSVWVSVHA